MDYCKDCKYWECFEVERIDEKIEDSIGWCRRSPPTNRNCYDDLGYSVHDETVAKCWCGEFRSKKPTYPTLEAIDLAPLTERILRRRGRIDSVEKLLDCTPKYIKSLRGIGPCAYRDIVERLSSFGLFINGADEEYQRILIKEAEHEAMADAAVKEALGID